VAERVVVLPVDDQVTVLAPRGYIPLGQDDLSAVLEHGRVCAPLQRGESLRLERASPHGQGVAAVYLSCCAERSPVGVILDQAALRVLVSAALDATEADRAKGWRVSIVPPGGREHLLRRLLEGTGLDLEVPARQPLGAWGERPDPYPW
jgi:hypothetical protein